MSDRRDSEPLKPRLRQLLDLLPKHGWIVSRAAMEVGYSKTYAQKRLPKRLLENDTFCVAMAAKRREFMEATGWDQERWRRECEDALQRARDAHDRSAEVQVLRMMGQNIGVFEKDNSQRADGSLAAIALRMLEAGNVETVALPGPGVIDGEVVDEELG